MNYDTEVKVLAQYKEMVRSKIHNIDEDGWEFMSKQREWMRYEENIEYYREGPEKVLKLCALQHVADSHIKFMEHKFKLCGMYDYVLDVCMKGWSGFQSGGTPTDHSLLDFVYGCTRYLVFYYMKRYD